MSDAFRGSALRCPSCRVPLREFQERLVCDACAGIFIGLADLTTSINDLTLRDTQVRFVDDQPTFQRCPRCDAPLSACGIEILVERALDRRDVLRCARHGVWVGGGVLAEMFEHIGRRVLPRPPHSDEGGGGSAMAVADRVGLFRRHKIERPPVTVTPFVSAFADRRLACPVCPNSALRLGGDLWTCDVCAGAFVENGVVETKMTELAGGPWALPAPSGRAGARACPVCSETLAEDSLESVEVDRCAAHGVWFDAHELAAALAHASGVLEPKKSWLRRLFG
jgi:Zn-finger nucleic acid-binding protein